MNSGGGRCKKMHFLSDPADVLRKKPDGHVHIQCTVKSSFRLMWPEKKINNGINQWKRVTVFIFDSIFFLFMI